MFTSLKNGLRKEHLIWIATIIVIIVVSLISSFNTFKQTKVLANMRESFEKSIKESETRMNKHNTLLSNQLKKVENAVLSAEHSRRLEEMLSSAFDSGALDHCMDNMCVLLPGPVSEVEKMRIYRRHMFNQVEQLTHCISNYVAALPEGLSDYYFEHEGYSQEELNPNHKEN